MDEEPASSKRKRSDSEELRTEFGPPEKRKKPKDVWQKLDLSENADVNAKDEDGWTALHRAAADNSHETARVLIEHNADVNVKDDYGCTALHRAAKNNSHETARVLVEHNADVNVKDAYGWTALHWAANKNSHETVRVLMEHNADVNVKDAYGWTDLHWAAEFNSHETARVLIEHNADVNVKNDYGCTALHRAAKKNSHETVRVLMEHNADVNVKDKAGWTAPHWAIKNNSHETARVLVEHLVDLNAKDSDGRTALHWAAESNNCEKARDLLEYKADENDLYSSTEHNSPGISYDEDVEVKGETTLHCFAVDDRNNSEIDADASSKNQDKESLFLQLVRCALPKLVPTQFFISERTDIDCRNSEGESILHLIIKYISFFQTVFVEKLLSFLLSSDFRKMVSVKSRDNSGHSPLHRWAQMHDTEKATVVEVQSFVEKIGMMLMSHGALVNAKNDSDETPLHLARSVRAASVLIREGATLNGLDVEGNTPLLSRVKGLSCESSNIYQLEPNDTPSEQFRVLFRRGMDPWIENIQGETVFSVLVQHKNVELARAFIEAVHTEDPPSVSHKSSCGNTPLHFACQSDRTDIHLVINTLLTYCANPNVQNNRGETPLHVACKMAVDQNTGYESLPFWVVKILLQHHASPELQDQDGQTCLAIATANSYLSKLLQDQTETIETGPIIRWSRSSETHRDKLAKVAQGQMYRTVKSYFYHLKEIGSGAFSRVYAGINKNDGREIALKQLSKVKLKRPEDRREIANLVKLKDCDQIVKYLDWMEDEHSVTIVLELMEGTLDDYLNKRKTASSSEDIALIQDLIKGLEFLHKGNPTVLHRDIKPSNVLYKTRPRLCIKIADFGLSTKADPDTTESTVGTGSAFAGTRCWMAPEVLNGNSKHSTGSDVFCAGLVVHVILAVNKRHPFAPENVMGRSKADVNNATERNIMHCTHTLDKRLSSEARHLINRMLDSNRDNRPSTTDLLAHPFFWTNERKHRFLIAVGNQQQFEVPRGRFSPTQVESDLENGLGKQFVTSPWNVQINSIFNQVTTSPKSRRYDTSSAVSLVRFVRNTIAHISDGRSPWPTWMKELVLEKFEFLTKFPSLVMEVYTVVIAHGWDKEDEIKYVLKETV